jgi:hypothetical protein
MSIDRHTLAIISITGSSLDVLGALYLAYDLLGGVHGPLRTLTRAVTYGTFFGIGYGAVLGPVFGVASGIAHGITLASELSRAARNQPKPGVLYDTAMSGIRGLGYFLGTAYLYGPIFGLTFALLSTVGQVIAYRAGMRPTLDYEPATRPRLTLRQSLGVVNRTIGYGATAYISALLAHERGIAWHTALIVGLAVGVMTAILTAAIPFVEWGADHVPEKRMGVLGIGLILVGFMLQSVQYWVALLDVGVR